MKIKNVILDMGNVLLDYNPDYSLEVLCENPESRAVIKKELFEGSEWVLADLGLISCKERYETIKKRIPEKYHAELKKVSDNWDVCMTPLEGASEFCRYIKEKGFKVYILSNASVEFYTYFSRYFSLDFFDGYVVSCDLHIIKPDERIYRYILDKYALDPAESIFVDDRYENVVAAEKTGMKGYVFKGDFGNLKKELL